MFKKVRYIYILIILFFVTSCISESTESNSKITVALGAGSTEKIWMNDIFEVENWIELEADSSAMLSNVSKIEVTKDAIYILTRSSYGKICKFDKQGRYICNIGNYGHGHGEYIFLNDFTIDKKNNEVLLLADFSKIIKYKSDGRYISSKMVGNYNMANIKATANGVFTSSNHRCFNTQKDNCLLYQLNDSLIHINEWFSTLNVQNVPLVSSVFQNIKDNLYYIDNFKNCIYHYDNIAKVFSNEIGFSLPNPCPINIFDDNKLFSQKYRDVDFIKNVIFDNERILVIYSIMGTTKLSVINLSDGKIVKEGIYSGEFSYITFDEDYIYTVFSPEWFYKSKTIEKFNKRPKNMPNSQSNSYIAVLRTKSFGNK